MKEIINKTMTCAKLLQIDDSCKDGYGRVNDLLVTGCCFTRPIKGLPIFEFQIKWRWGIVSFGEIKLFMGHLMGKNVIITRNNFRGWGAKAVRKHY